MPPKGYKQTSLPDQTMKAIDNLIKRLKELEIGPAYNSRADFIKEAVNIHITDIIQTYFIGERGE